MRIVRVDLVNQAKGPFILSYLRTTGRTWRFSSIRNCSRNQITLWPPPAITIVFLMGAAILFSYACTEEVTEYKSDSP